MMSTTAIPSIELPAGYALLERLGAGGYGEVWKATAPGGVEKAVKLIFGHCDEDLAGRELKSLERIRSVRHPFVLSIERYEVVNHRLVIVTELADMSLDECFQQHRAKGRSGVPRDELLGYLSDAAEALDCLVDQHSLQHLDIKPENLLVVGDHVKVADFGLVKQLATRTLNSMMGGMTPIYSAPEIYDDNPSPRSDQYSLAIVFQQMLTGALPFPGRTPAQLAKQHTQAEPNLQSLDERDRRVVRRALEKDPAARFSSCREFIAALRTSSVDVPASGNPAPQRANEWPSPPIGEDDTQSLAAADTQHLPESLRAELTQRLAGTARDLPADRPMAPTAPLPAFPSVSAEITDLDVPDLAAVEPAPPPPTLFLATGGVGMLMLTEIRQRIARLDAEASADPQLAWLAIDTDRQTLTAATRHDDAPLSEWDVLHTPLRRPKQYRQASQDLLRWTSRRWLYNIPRSLETRSFRPLGRIALVDHAEAVLRALEVRIDQLARRETDSSQPPGPIRVVLLAGMSGGTGSGTALDLAQAVRSVCRELGVEVTIDGILASTYLPDGSDSLAAANMYSLLAELHHAQHSGNCGDSPPPGAAARYESPARPFDDLYLVALPHRNDGHERQAALESVADYCAIEATSPLGGLLAALRQADDDSHDPFALRTFRCVAVEELARWLQNQRQAQFAQAVINFWSEDGARSDDPDARLFGNHAQSRFAHCALAKLPPVGDDPSDDDASARRARRRALLQHLATAWHEFLDSHGPHDQCVEVDPAELAAVTDDVVQQLAAALSSRPTPTESPGELLARLLAGQVEDRRPACDPQQLTSVVLDQTNVGPLDCGYRRRNLLLVPTEESQALAAEFTRQRPTVAVRPAPVAAPLLVSEGSDLRALHLAARLAETYPDILAAASRLHTRNDIPWRDLRT